MRKALLAIGMAVLIQMTSSVTPVHAALFGVYEVTGVEGDDMLKMRSGPGTGYRVLLGLPNGTALRVHECQQTGSTRWCKVSLDGARGFKGYVSWAYLRKR